jgi:hypothetical protein
MFLFVWQKMLSMSLFSGSNQMNANDRYELAHSGSKSTASADSPKSSSHDDSTTGTPDPLQQSSNNNPSVGAHQHKHSTGGHSNSLSHRATPDQEHHSGGSPTMSSAPGFPPHFSLASYYSQLNQAGISNGAHGGPLTPSLAHMAQYGQHPGVQNPYQMSHQSPGSTPTSGNGGGDFRRALPVLF